MKWIEYDAMVIATTSTTVVVVSGNIRDSGHIKNYCDWKVFVLIENILSAKSTKLIGASANSNNRYNDDCL